VNTQARKFGSHVLVALISMFSGYLNRLTFKKIEDTTEVKDLAFLLAELLLRVEPRCDFLSGKESSSILSSVLPRKRGRPLGSTNKRSIKARATKRQKVSPRGLNQKQKTFQSTSVNGNVPDGPQEKSSVT
jgi:hypothetical protein